MRVFSYVPLKKVYRFEASPGLPSWDVLLRVCLVDEKVWVLAL